MYTHAVYRLTYCNSVLYGNHWVFFRIDHASNQEAEPTSIYRSTIERPSRHGNTCGVFLRVTHAPNTKGRGPSVPEVLWDFLHARTRYKKQRPNFAKRCKPMSTTPPAWPKFLWHECWRAICLRQLTFLYCLRVVCVCRRGRWWHARLSSAAAVAARI